MSRFARARLLILAAMLLLGVGLPILAMTQCEGMNGANWEYETCSPDWPIVYSVAEAAFGWITIASMTAGIPLIIYLAILWAAADLLARRLTRD